MQQRLAASDHHNRGAAFVHRAEAIGKRQALVQDLIGIVDLAAARASQIATKQGLQHQDQRIALNTLQGLRHHIGANLRHLQDRNAHLASFAD